MDVACPNRHLCTHEAWHHPELVLLIQAHQGEQNNLTSICITNAFLLRYCWSKGIFPVILFLEKQLVGWTQSRHVISSSTPQWIFLLWELISRKKDHYQAKYTDLIQIARVICSWTISCVFRVCSNNVNFAAFRQLNKRHWVLAANSWMPLRPRLRTDRHRTEFPCAVLARAVLIAWHHLRNWTIGASIGGLLWRKSDKSPKALSGWKAWCSTYILASAADELFELHVNICLQQTTRKVQQITINFKSAQQANQSKRVSRFEP